MQEQTEDYPFSTIDAESDPIPFWPIDYCPTDADVREALDADRWARLDALAGWVE